jgi:hypothetical protein
MVALSEWISDVKLLDKTYKCVGEAVSYYYSKDKHEVMIDRAHMDKKIKIDDCFYVKALAAPKNKVCFLRAIKVLSYQVPTTLKTEYMYPSVHCKILGNVERLAKRMLKETV